MTVRKRKREKDLREKENLRSERLIDLETSPQVKVAQFAYFSFHGAAAFLFNYSCISEVFLEFQYLPSSVGCEENAFCLFD